MIYLIGSLRNPYIPGVAQHIRNSTDAEVFDDWWSAGEEADDSLRDYYKSRGHTYAQALAGPAAQHIVAFDKKYLDACDAAVLVMPAGKSAHLELGYVIGQGKPGFILMDGEPERYDIMYNLASGVFTDEEDLIATLKKRGIK